MLTLGIDLASKPVDTAACFLEWEDTGAKSMRLITRELTDSALLELMNEADRIAIDAPFGWPDPFVEALVGWRNAASWPGADRESLKFRETDRAVKKRGQNPMSVSADKIAVTAMRCAFLLDRYHAHGEIDRCDGRIVEAYPAATFRSWGISCAGYKGTNSAQAARRREVVVELLRRAPWLHLPPPSRENVERSDHQLDALVCAIVARAASVGETIAPTMAQRDSARREGWIHVPNPGSLDRLAEA